MKNNKISPIRECSCCWEYVDIEMEIFNCPNDKCTYILCKKCLISLGKKTKSDKCPACRTKLPLHYKPIELITEETYIPTVIIMNRNTRRLVRRPRIEDDLRDCCNDWNAGCWGGNNCMGDIMYCINNPKFCTNICISFIATLLLWVIFSLICLLIGHLVSMELYPEIYCCMHPTLTFIFGGIIGCITLIMFVSLLLLCGRCCEICYKLPNIDRVY